VPRRDLSDLERDPTNVGYHELLGILRARGCRVREGTKHGAIANCGGTTLTIPRPHRGDRLKPVYVRLAVRALRGGGR